MTAEEIAALNTKLREMGIDPCDRSTHPMGLCCSWDLRSHVTPAPHRFMHLCPSSILITPIGNLWEDGCWYRLQDMMLYTARQGYSVSIHEMSDASLFSGDAIGLMRWSASMLARDGGVEWLLMVDNDVMLQPDTLVRLLAHDRPVVFPLLNDLEQKWPKEVSPLSNPPDLASGGGLVPVRWAAMSVMLFNAKIFNVLETMAWWGTDYHFGQALNNIGHRIYVDTDTRVDVVRGPSRHGAKEYDAFWEHHRAMQSRIHYEERNRSAPPSFNPLTDDGWLDKDGTYFAVPNEATRTKPPLTRAQRRRGE